MKTLITLMVVLLLGGCGMSYSDYTSDIQTCKDHNMKPNIHTAFEYVKHVYCTDDLGNRWYMKQLRGE